MNLTQRTVGGLFLGLAVAAAASAEGSSLRWNAGAQPLGLQTPQWRVPCGSVALPCAASTLVPLYASEDVPRSLSMQVSAGEHRAAPLEAASGSSLSVVGQAGFAQDLGIYGRIGAATARSLPGWSAEPGLSYGVGLSWDFSRQGSAILGWDSYDLRSTGGDSREVRATSLGLQWRY